MYNMSPHQQLRCHQLCCRNKRKIITEVSPEGNIYDAGNCVIVTWEDEVNENEKEQTIKV